MNVTAHTVRWAAACLLLALRPAAAAESPAEPERAAAVHAKTQAAVRDAAPAPPGGASAPIGAGTHLAVPMSPVAVDWSYTPRRTFQGRRR